MDFLLGDFKIAQIFDTDLGFILSLYILQVLASCQSLKQTWGILFVNLFWSHKVAGWGFPTDEAENRPCSANLTPTPSLIEWFESSPIHSWQNWPCNIKESHGLETNHSTHDVYFFVRAEYGYKMLRVAGCSGFKSSSKHLMHIKLCSTLARLGSVKYPSQSEDSSLDMSRIYVLFIHTRIYTHTFITFTVCLYIHIDTCAHKCANIWKSRPSYQRKPNPGSYQSLSFANRWLYLRPFSNSLWKRWRRFFALLPLSHEKGYLDLYRTHLGTVWRLICCERLEFSLFSFFLGGSEHVSKFSPRDCWLVTHYLSFFFKFIFLRRDFLF